MNIFVLDYNPKTSAQYHCDTHVVKMILESAQMMCTVGKLLDVETPYKMTHKNHPCTIWARESRQNFEWLLELFEHLHHEWQYRYQHKEPHLSYRKMQDVDTQTILEKLPNIGLTKFAQAMPDDYRSSDCVKAYRQYYVKEKSKLLNYTIRQQPKWIGETI